MVGAPELSARERTELQQRLLAAALADAHPNVRAWRGPALAGDLEQALADALQSLVDDEAAQAFCEQMRALALPPRVFKSRLIETGAAAFLACINFRDVSGDYPFVRVLAATGSPGAMGDWSQLSAALRKAFSEFAPRAVLFFHPAHLPLAAPAERIDDHLLAAQARTMAVRPAPAGIDRVVLQRAASTAFYPRYRELYEAVYAEREPLRGEVRTETEQSLAHCLEQGYLFEILIDGAWAGVIAAEPRTVAGLHGVYMVEIVLARQARGQRLGPAVHHRFATAVAGAEPNAVILGTISAKNPWSRETALRAGRIEIGAWHWVDL